MTVNVCEIFTSIQGESSYAGLSCFFVRLAGCNLRCRYCDTPQAFEPGTERAVGDLVSEWRASRAVIAEITGGEPLLQPGFVALATALRDASPRPVLVETNGSRDLSLIPDRVVAIMDVKTPGSGQADAFNPANLGRLRPGDEVKFVLTGRADYEWARAFVAGKRLTGGGRTVLFSAAVGLLPGSDLAQWIVEDGLAVRLQVQLHKVLALK